MKLIDKLYKYWNRSLSGDLYHDTANPDVQKFGHVHGIPLSAKDRAKYVKLQSAIKNLRKTFKELLLFIRTNYLELEIDELSKLAYEEYVDYYKE